MCIYRGYIGIMEKKIETTIMENQMEKKMENEMETDEEGNKLPQSATTRPLDAYPKP